MKYRPIGVLSVGHLVTDVNQGALPAMLPFFIAAYDLSYAAAAGIVFAANMTSITIIGRSIIFYGLNTFIPIYWINALNQSKAAGAVALTIFTGSGIIGNLMGGSLADRIGQKKVMLLGFFGLTLFLPLLILVNKVQIATLLLVPIGLMLYGTYNPSIVLGQSYLPNRVGLSSGVTLGVAVAIGGGAAPIIGRIADLYGIWYSLASIACLPMFFSAIALSLPGSQRVVAKINDNKPLTTVQID
jgi:FSR family fosmidomycin resistance protein-like MFS transporter